MKVYRRSPEVTPVGEEPGFVIYLSYDEAYYVNLVASLQSTVRTRLLELHLSPKLVDRVIDTMSELWAQSMAGVGA